MQCEFAHAYEWRVGDLVICDNRTTIPRARPTTVPIVASRGG